MPYADPEQIVQRWLIANVFPGAGTDRVLVTTGEPNPSDQNIQHSQRLVRVKLLPSSPGDAVPTLDIADLEINCYARSPDRVKAITDVIRVAMRYQFEKSTDATTGAFVKQVRWLSVPTLVPSDTAMFARFRASARLWIHHSPL
jgi:hypothetical protein